MPIYEYQCMTCGGVSEFLVGVGKAEELKCRHCDSSDLYKLMSAPNISMGGSGPSGPPAGGCCGAPGSCGSPGSCCSG